MAITLTFPNGGALIAGGTGRLGEGMVRQFAKAGVPQVFTFAGNEDKARALEAELKDEGHVVAAVRMDAQDMGSIRAALDRVIADHGRVHTVAVGAGVPVTFAKMADFPVEEVERFVAGMSPFSKGSLDALVRQLAYEEAENGIRVNAIAIGWLDRLTIEETRQYIPAGRPETFETQTDMTRAILDQMEGLIRFHRPGTLEEGGNLAAFLASDQASFLTGQIIDFDGGATL
jgi:NAD(P)-dependent dehydrogenase (short-subunit alcohol dehydrogenase family)